MLRGLVVRIRDRLKICIEHRHDACVVKAFAVLPPGNVRNATSRRGGVGVRYGLLDLGEAPVPEDEWALELAKEKRRGFVVASAETNRNVGSGPAAGAVAVGPLDVHSCSSVGGAP